MLPPAVVEGNPHGWCTVNYAGGGQTAVQGTMLTWLDWAVRTKGRFDHWGEPTISLVHPSACLNRPTISLPSIFGFV